MNHLLITLLGITTILNCLASFCVTYCDYKILNKLMYICVSYNILTILIVIICWE